MFGRTASDGVADASRRAIFDAFRTFQQIPKDVAAQSADDAHKLQILTCSENFREQLRTLAAQIGSVAETEGVREGGLSLDGDYDTVYSIEKSWQICEIFSINPTKLLSIELIKWLKELCYEQPLEVFLGQIQDSDEPENMNLQDIGATDSGEFGYWDLVYTFILQGDLESALSALKVHSEISEAFLAPSNTIRGTKGDAAVAISGNTITRTQCESFFELLLTHPFANMTKQASIGYSSSTEGLLSREALLASTTHTISVEFSAWQNRVRKLRQSNMTLLTRIPELDTILRILTGDISTLEHLCGVEEQDGQTGGWAWGKLAIALLLFVYPPPLTKTDLCRIVEECMQKGSSASNSSALDKSYITTLREVMTGHVAPTLRSFYHLGVTTASASHVTNGATTAPHARVLSLVPLLCTAHLSLLLVSGANKEDLLIPIEKSANETSFFEEIFLESASRLHSLGFPAEVMLNYLSVCPMRGKEFARVLLPLVPIASDKSALAVAQTLRESLGLYQEASSLLVARGMWWLRQNPSPPLRSAGPDARERQLHSSTLAKAACFFQEAGDASRLQVLLESSLSRCMWAVKSNSKAFPGLLLTPSACSLYGDALRAPRNIPGQDEQVTDASNLLELEAALVEAEELLQAVDVSYLEPSGSQIACMMSQALRSYVNAVQGRFVSPTAGALRQAAQELAGLVTDPIRGPSIPIRYWLHTLELVTWFANCASGLEGNGKSTPSESEDQEMQTDEGSANRSVPNGAVFSKAQAYALLSALQEVCSSHGADLLLTEASTHADANVNSTIAQKDQLQVLRLSLLSLLAKSTVYENAERRSNKAQDNSTMKMMSSLVGRSAFGRTVALNSRSFNKFASATNRFQPQDSDTLKKAMALEMLSGSSLEFL